jgi:hypothetical protein
MISNSMFDLKVSKRHPRRVMSYFRVLFCVKIMNCLIFFVQRGNTRVVDP